MNTRIIPVTLALVDAEERKRLERIISANCMVRLQDEDAPDMGVLVYEPGPSVDEDLPHIIQALESGQADDVYLAGREADPDLLIRAMRAGIREFLRYPVAEEDFRAAVMRTALRLNQDEPDAAHGRIITCLGGKEGQGATTLAVNLAWALNREEPGATALLDLRTPVGEVPHFLDLRHEYTWGDVVEDISRLDPTYLQSVMAEGPDGLHVLPAPRDGERPDPQALFMILAQLRQNYAHVVVDAAWPGEDGLPKEIEEADTVLVALGLTLPALARAGRMLTVIRSLDPDADRRMRVVANRVLGDSSISVEEAADVLGRAIDWTVPDDPVAVQAALNQGAPVLRLFPKSPASRAVNRIATALRPPREGKRSGGLFSLFARLGRRRSETGEPAGAAS
ncbi:AAA family ATPase [Pseudodesulfovibrio tunisiensis]|uniref:AAA family ATPase n=1 Tax=Pseudodesulfovibrio tunisiensis TaxID=463192 RepID=UPI001FB432A9|nr:histidine kinase [Pseudodesulfovibrio tunisiensis]